MDFKNRISFFFRPFLWFFALTGIVFFTLVVLGLIAMGQGIGNLISISQDIPSSGGRASKYILPIPKKKTPFVAGIKWSGPISSDPVNGFLEQIEEVKETPSILGLFLEMDSPGGTVVASQEMYQALKDLVAVKPVVAYVRESAASGAYYAIAPVSKIIANRGSWIGSIGVVMPAYDASELLSFLKVKASHVTSGKFKDTGSPLRPSNPDERAYVQDLVRKVHSQFANDVQTARNLPPSTMAHMADARVVLGEEALSLKLVDALGDKKVALLELQSLLKLKELPKPIFFEEKTDLKKLLQNAMGASLTSLLNTHLSL